MNSAKTEQARRRVILVIGMHRSGTSAVARVVNLLGADLGGALIPPGFDNPKGFWELSAAVQINDDLLHALGRTWYDMREMPANWLETPAAKEALGKITQVIHKDFSNHSLCALKDPRLCLVAPLWIEAFRAAGFEVACVFAVRNPSAVVGSLHLRNDWPHAPLYLMWVQYMMEATAATIDCPRAMVTYEGLLLDWRSTMARVAEDLGLHWPVDFGTAAGEISGFLDSDHKTAESAADPTAHSPDAAPEFVSRLYGACLAIVDRKGDWSRIDQLRKSFQSTAELYAKHVDNLLNQRWAAEARAERAQQSTAVLGIAAVQEWTARFGRLDAGVKAMSDRMDQLLVRVADMKEQEQQAVTNIARAQTVEQGLEVLAGKAIDGSARLAERVQAIQQRVENLAVESAKVNASSTDRSEAIRSQMEQSQREMRERLAEHLQAIQQRLENLAVESAKVNALSTERSEAIRSQMEQSQRDMQERLGHAEQQASQQTSALSALELRWQRRVDRQDRLLQTLHRRVEQLEPMLTGNLNAGYAELRRRDDALEQKVQDLQRVVSGRKVDTDVSVRELTARIQALTSSTSWKVTAPLRWVKRRLRPGARVVK